MRHIILFLLLTVGVFAIQNKLIVLPQDPAGGSPQFDAFNRLTVANPYTLADVTFYNSLNTLQISTGVTGSGTIYHNSTKAMAILSHSTAAGDFLTMQSDHYYNYQAGKAQKIVISNIVTTPTSDCIKRWGYFDVNDGLFFELDATGLSVVQRTSTSGTVVDTKLRSGSWNGKSSGAKDWISGLDYNTSHIWEIDFQWLGSGFARFGAYDDNGEFRVLHTFRNQNTVQGPYMKSANLPVRFELFSTNAATIQTMAVICFSVVSSGGDNPPVDHYATSMTSTYATTQATEVHLITIRAKSTKAGQLNRTQSFLKQLNMSCLTSGAIFNIYKNAAPTGLSFSNVSSLSGMEVSTKGNWAASGIRIGAIPFQVSTGGGNQADGFSTGQDESHIDLTYDHLGSTGDSITITAQRLAATNAVVVVGIEWDEVR